MVKYLAILLLLPLAVCGQAAYTFQDHPFMVNGAFSVVRSGLVQWLESVDFDTAGGTSVHTWTDRSGNANHMTHGAEGGGGISGSDYAPIVDSTVKAGQHNTLGFYGSNVLVCAAYFPASPPGLEIMAVFKNANDPAGVGDDDRNCVFSYTRAIDYWVGFPGDFSYSAVPGQPDNTGHFAYETFGNGADLYRATDTHDLGAEPFSTATSFVTYNISSAGDGSSYKAWLNSTVIADLGTNYSFRARGCEISGDQPFYSIGGAIRFGLGGSFGYSKTHIAAIFVWERTLTVAERTQMRGYIAHVYGVGF